MVKSNDEQAGQQQNMESKTYYEHILRHHAHLLR